MATTHHLFINDGEGKTFASMMHEAIEKMENDLYFPGILSIHPEYQKNGLWVTVIYNEDKQYEDIIFVRP